MSNTPIIAIIALALAAISMVLYGVKFRAKNGERKHRIIFLLLGAALLWVGLDLLLAVMPGTRHYSIAKPVVFGYEQPWGVVIGWFVVALVLVFALAVNALVVRRMKDSPGKFQNLLEGCCQAFMKKKKKRASEPWEKAPEDPQTKERLDAEAAAKAKRKRIRNLVIVAAWVACGLLMTQLQKLTGAPVSEGLHISITAPKFALFQLFGRDFYATDTIISTWIIMAALTAAALVIRIFCIPKFKDVPGGLQNFLETAVEYAGGYTRGKVGNLNDSLPAYIFALGALLIASSLMEAVGLHSPTLDLTFTLALALITFVLINYFGIKKKGIRGRLMHYMKPAPYIAPIKLLGDIAVPISMACRLFGNMLGGLIVMELIYMALGNFATGIAATAGLFFNVFHPLIQAFIFITLTLTFIEEAVD